MMILRDSEGDPIVFTIQVGNEWEPDRQQLVKGNLKLLGEPIWIRYYSGADVRKLFSDEPIGLVFVPEREQEVMFP